MREAITHYFFLDNGLEIEATGYECFKIKAYEYNTLNRRVNVTKQLKIPDKFYSYESAKKLALELEKNVAL